MAKKQDWKQALSGLGAKTSPVIPDPTITVGLAPERQYASEAGPAATSEVPVREGLSADPAEYPSWVFRWIQAVLELLGRAILVRALYDAMEGSNKPAMVFESRIEMLIDRLPSARAEVLRQELFSLYRGKGCPTFCSNARAVMEALQSGAYDTWLAADREQAGVAEALVVPRPEEGEEIEAFGARLRAWASDKPEAILKRVGFNAWEIIRAEESRRTVEAEALAEKKDADERSVLASVLVGAVFATVFTAIKEWAMAKKIAGVYPGNYSDQILGSRWGWALYQAFTREKESSISFYSGPTVAPLPEAAALLTDRFLLGCATHVNFPSVEQLGGEIRRRWPLSSDQAALVEVGKDGDGNPIRYAVYADGEVKKVVSFPPTAGTYTTTPDPKGWWNRLQGFEAGVWCGPSVYQALKRLERAVKGAVLITPAVMSAYGRHPEKGYPRLLFEVGAGRRRSSFELPVWRPIQGEGALVERLDDIRLLAGHKLSVPEAATWMDIQVGVTQKGNPRIEPSRSGQSVAPAILLYTSEGAMSNGKWGWSGETHSAVKGSEKGGSKILWSTFVSSSGGGVHRTADVLLVVRGGSIAMTSGQSVTFDGEKVVKVAGGGVDLTDDPTRG